MKRLITMIILMVVILSAPMVVLAAGSGTYLSPEESGKLDAYIEDCEKVKVSLKVCGDFADEAADHLNRYLTEDPKWKSKQSGSTFELRLSLVDRKWEEIIPIKRQTNWGMTGGAFIGGLILGLVLGFAAGG